MAGESSGSGDQAKGRLRKAWGELTDNQEQKDKGTVEKTTGKVKETVDRVGDRVKGALDRDRNRT